MSGTEKKYLYQHIYRELKEDIFNEIYPVGSLLPTEGELCKKFNVSVTPLRKAIDLLTHEGIVRPTQGRGTEVISKTIIQKFPSVTSVLTSLDAPQNKGYLETMQIQEAILNNEEAAALERPVNSPCYRINRLWRRPDGQVVNLIIDTVPYDLAPGLIKYKDKFESLFPFLKETYGVTHMRSETTIRIVESDLMQSSLFNLEPGSPVVLYNRTAYTEKEPMDYQISYSRTKDFSITLKMDK